MLTDVPRFTILIVKREFSVSLSANVPTPLGISVGGETGIAWSTDAASEVSRQGSDPTATYFPLYNLKKRRVKKWYHFRGRGEMEHDIDG